MAAGGAPSYGQSSMLDVFMTSDAGRRWVLRGRFPRAGLLDIVFLNPSTGFIDTEVGQGTSEDRAQIYATSDGGKHWREVSVINDSCGNVGGLSFASPRVGFLSGYCGSRWPGLLRTSDGGRRWGYVPIPAPYHSDYGGVFPPVFSSPQARQHGRGGTPRAPHRHHHRRRPPLGPEAPAADRRRG